MYTATQQSLVIEHWTLLAPSLRPAFTDAPTREDALATARETGRVWLQNKMRQHSRDSFSACLGFGYTSKNNSQFSTAYGSLLGLALNSLSYICATGTFEVPRKGPSSKKIHTKIPQTDAQRPDCFKEEVKGPSCPVSRPEPTHRLLGRKQPSIRWTWLGNKVPLVTTTATWVPVLVY